MIKIKTMKMYVINIKIKLVVSLLFITLVSNLYSQNLNLSQLLSLRNKNIAEIEEFLTAKNWNFIGVENETVTFSYNQSDYDSKAESFVNIISIGSHNWLRIQIHRKEKYSEYLNVIKSYGCKLIESKMTEDGNILKTYQGKSTTFIIELSSNEADYGSVKTLYLITIIPNEDYIYWE